MYINKEQRWVGADTREGWVVGVGGGDTREGWVVGVGVG